MTDPSTAYAISFSAAFAPPPAWPSVAHPAARPPACLLTFARQHTYSGGLLPGRALSILLLLAAAVYTRFYSMSWL
ncbi:hypothetical protein MPTK2_2g13230 [Marchantia polymorpha subsp. ruderalis]